MCNTNVEVKCLSVSGYWTLLVLTFGYVTPHPFSLHVCYILYASHLQVTPPEFVKRRYRHSITASKLEPELTKVLVFGGKLKWPKGSPIAETATLEFGKSCMPVTVKVSDWL